MSGLLKEVFLRDPIPLPSPQVQVCAKQAKEDLRAAAAVKPPLGHAGNNKVKPAKPGKIDVWGSPSCEGCMREVLSFKRNKVPFVFIDASHDPVFHMKRPYLKFDESLKAEKGWEDWAMPPLLLRTDAGTVEEAPVHINAFPLNVCEYTGGVRVGSMTVDQARNWCPSLTRDEAGRQEL